MNNVRFSVSFEVIGANQLGTITGVSKELRDSLRSPLLVEFFGESPKICNEFPELLDARGDIDVTGLTDKVKSFLEVPYVDEFISGFKLPVKFAEFLSGITSSEEAALTALVFMRKRVAVRRSDRIALKNEQARLADERKKKLEEFRQSEERRLQEESERQVRIDEERRERLAARKKEREESELGRLQAEIRNLRKELKDMKFELLIAQSSVVREIHSASNEFTPIVRRCPECDRAVARHEFAKSGFKTNGGVAGVSRHSNGEENADIQYHGGRFHEGEW